jgi:hypothetical protein
MYIEFLFFLIVKKAIFWFKKLAQKKVHCELPVDAEKLPTDENFLCLYYGTFKGITVRIRLEK